MVLLADGSLGAPRRGGGRGRPLVRLRLARGRGACGRRNRVPLVIDHGKCQKWYGIHVDQGLHVACKLLWWGLLAGGVSFRPEENRHVFSPDRATRAAGGRSLLAVLAALAAGGAGGYLIATRSNGPSTTEPRGSRPPGRDASPPSAGSSPPTGVVPVYGPPGDRIAKLYPLAPGTILDEGDPDRRAGQPQGSAPGSAGRRDATGRGDQGPRCRQARGRAEDPGGQGRTQPGPGKQGERPRRHRRQDQATSNSESRRPRPGSSGWTSSAPAASRSPTRTREGPARGRQADAELTATEATRKKTETTYTRRRRRPRPGSRRPRPNWPRPSRKVPIKSSEEKLTLAEQLSRADDPQGPDRRHRAEGDRPRGPADRGGADPPDGRPRPTMTAVAEVYESDVERLAGG